jgi:hypothetical protein
MAFIIISSSSVIYLSVHKFSLLPGFGQVRPFFVGASGRDEITGG